MKKLPPARRAETLFGRVAANFDMLSFAFLKVDDEAAEFAFAMHCAMETDEAKRSGEVAQAAISRASKS